MALVSGSYFSRLVPWHSYAEFSGRSLPETFPYSALFGSTVDTCLSADEVRGSMVQPTVDLPQLPFIAGRQFPCCGAEVDSHGPACSEDHGDSAVAVCFLVVDAPVVQVVRGMPVDVTTGRMVQTLQKLVVDVAVVCQRQIVSRR